MRNTYFAAMNSGRGFISFYPELFDTRRLNRLYLIKGGPGTGKSSLLRRTAEEAERRGLSVRRYLCSSDPESLDGIVVGDGIFAMVDATAPHCLESALPGAGDELLDLGRFWLDSALIERRGEIEGLNQKKQAAYARAYQWLNALGVLDHLKTGLLKRCLDDTKLQRAAERYLARVKSGTGSVVPAQTAAMGMKGAVSLESMHRISARAYILSDEREGGHLFLHTLAAVCRERKIDMMQSYMISDPSQYIGIYLPQDGLAFLCSNCAGAPREQDKVINMERFWRKSELRQVRSELNRVNKTKKEILEGVMLAFTEAKAAHFALEQIYADAMDFRALSLWSDELIQRVFSTFEA